MCIGSYLQHNYSILQGFIFSFIYVFSTSFTYSHVTYDPKMTKMISFVINVWNIDTVQRLEYLESIYIYFLNF